MDNIYKYDRERLFFHELLKDIQEDIHFLNDFPGKVYITLTEHLKNVNGRVPDPFKPEELIKMEECIKNAVKDLTDLDLNTYLCTGVVVLSEYLDSPEDLFYYIGKSKKHM
ncbi:uncharacterized protein LOC112599423 [Melanaphis sacchari]|uniref:uncharacterized protein LOC112599423 n=1 Tax=Melanaphis sacchari TaxID=742174 RepID=UPI000DC15494|nr:uncharacterized protein LOC112599423 [Melanaphis sacchari]